MFFDGGDDKYCKKKEEMEISEIYFLIGKKRGKVSKIEMKIWMKVKYRNFCALKI